MAYSCRNMNLPLSVGEGLLYEGRSVSVLLSCCSRAWAGEETCSFIFLPGRKVTTRFSGTGTCSPVRGLRPIRDTRVLVSKMPKPRNSKRSPSARDRVIVLSISSNTLATSDWVIPRSLATLIVSSRFVIVIVLTVFPVAKEANADPLNGPSSSWGILLGSLTNLPFGVAAVYFMSPE